MAIITRSKKPQRRSIDNDLLFTIALYGEEILKRELQEIRDELSKVLEASK